jgi:hypothetical protein
MRAELFKSPRFLATAAVVVGVLLWLANQQAAKIQPAFSSVPVVAKGSFTPGGWYQGEPFAHAEGVRAWGSWSGADDNQGTIVIGPFAAPAVLHCGVSGYPDDSGNTLAVELIETRHRIEVKCGPIGERWAVIDVVLPSEWQGRPIRLLGTDHATALGGWFGVSEPTRGGRSDGNRALLDSLATWWIIGLLLALPFFAATRELRSRTFLPEYWLPLAAGAMVAAAGYVAFWLYFVHPLAGVIFSWALLGAAALRLFRTSTASTSAAPELRRLLVLLVLVGGFELSVLHLFPTAHDFYTLAANRYRDHLPSDNLLPHALGERLFSGQSARNPAEEWRSSDRPPLQTGWQLLTWSAAKALRLDRKTASGVSGVWFQLLWVAGAYGLLRALGVSAVRAPGWVGVYACCGFFAQNTVFTWPKLSAAAFAIGAFGFFVLAPPGPGGRNVVWAAFFAGLAWLSHGGVAFSFLALLPWLAGRGLRGERAGWARAAVVLAILILPWLAYQKFYDPPANRLFKWHLAGQEKIDPRGTLETIKASYAQAGWRTIWANKVANFHGQVFGDWRSLLDPSSAHAAERGRQEFFHSGRALTWWPPLALFAFALHRRRRFTDPPGLPALAGWLALTIAIWCLLMFHPYSAVIHQGSYAVMIGAFVFFSVLLDRAGRGWLGLITALQIFTFATTWAVANDSVSGPADGLPLALSFAAGLVGFTVCALRAPHPAPAAIAGEWSSEPAPRVSRWQRSIAALAAWWRNPRLNAWVLLALAFLMFLRKPHALHTPQLWAEDGSVFLNDQDEHGLAAFFSPYMGYVHALPRIIAWAAAKLLDPAWWPAFYNGSAFLVWLAVIARFLSPRLNLPGKPWLMLAFLLVPHTGEVFFNVTNLQWITAFVLLQQVLISPPRGPREQLGDFGLLLIVSLTGPFVIAFLPLFVWRWWRQRDPHSVRTLAVVTVCAIIQAWFVIRVGPKFPFQSAAFQLWPNLEIVARRLVVWPVLGFDAALALPRAVVGLLGGAVLALIAVGAWRRDLRRPLRLQILAAIALMLIAAVQRTRPDTWASDNLDFGDRYFYIPRVLLIWLLIWEFDALPRARANLARALCLAIAVGHIWTYQMPAPRDYHWAEHVDPIRRGERADIAILPENWTLEYRGRPHPR